MKGQTQVYGGNLMCCSSCAWELAASAVMSYTASDASTVHVK